MPVQFWSQVMVSKKNENCSVEVLSCDVVYDAVECGAKFECVKSSNLTIQMEAAEHSWLVFAAFFSPYLILTDCNQHLTRSVLMFRNTIYSFTERLSIVPTFK